MFDSFLFTFVLYGIHVLSMLFVFMYVHCCPWRITLDDIRTCRLAVTRRVSLVEQELLTILVHQERLSDDGKEFNIFRIITMFGSFLPSVVCRNADVIITLFVLVCEKWCQTHIA
jgi:hypothetical protein